MIPMDKIPHGKSKYLNKLHNIQKHRIKPEIVTCPFIKPTAHKVSLLKITMQTIS